MTRTAWIRIGRRQPFPVAFPLDSTFATQLGTDRPTAMQLARYYAGFNLGELVACQSGDQRATHLADSA